VVFFYLEKESSYYTSLRIVSRDHGSTVVKVLCYKSGGRWIPGGVIGFFIDMKSFRSHYGPRVDSASNRNEYQEQFLGGKGGRCVRLTTLPPSCAFVMKSGNLNFLEPSWPLQTCNGTASPLQIVSGLCGYCICSAWAVADKKLRCWKFRNFLHLFE